MIDDTSFETHQDQILQLGRIIVKQHAEIERLKAEASMMTEQAMHFRDMVQKQDCLLIRAADALEKYTGYPSAADALGRLYMVREGRDALIAELRKAAQ